MCQKCKTVYAIVANQFGVSYGAIESIAHALVETRIQFEEGQRELRRLVQPVEMPMTDAEAIEWGNAGVTEEDAGFVVLRVRENGNGTAYLAVEGNGFEGETITKLLRLALASREASEQGSELTMTDDGVLLNRISQQDYR